MSRLCYENPLTVDDARRLANALDIAIAEAYLAEHP